MEHLSEKKKKNVQRAEEKKPSEDDAETLSEEPAQTVAPFDFSKIDPEKIKIAEEMGIPIGQILQWVQSVEARFQYIAQNVATKEDLPVAFEQVIKNLQKQQMEQMAKQGVPPNMGGGGFPWQMVLSALSSGGGGQDPEIAQLHKKILQASYDNLIRKGDLTDRLVDAVISNVASKAVKDVTG